MPEETESSPTRKRRVIHWNPDAGKEQQRSRWTLKRIAAWAVGGPIALLLIAAVVIRGTKLVFGPQVFGGAPAVAAPVQPENAAAAFATETKAQFAHDTAVKGIAQIAKLPSNHPSQLPQLVIIQKGMIDGETLLERRDFAGALAKFEQLNRQIDEYVQSISAKQEAQDGFNTIMQRIKELEVSRNLMPEAIEAANTAAAESSRYFKEGSFLAAKRALESGFAELDKLVQARTDLIGTNLLRGQQALGVIDNAVVEVTGVGIEHGGLAGNGIHHLRVSAHYFIRRTGELIEFVPPELRAWHAGVSSWRGRERCNDFSIGIELEGCDTLPFEPVQYAQISKNGCGIGWNLQARADFMQGGRALQEADGKARARQRQRALDIGHRTLTPQKAVLTAKQLDEWDGMLACLVQHR